MTFFPYRLPQAAGGKAFLYLQFLRQLAYVYAKTPLGKPLGLVGTVDYQTKTLVLSHEQCHSCFYRDMILSFFDSAYFSASEMGERYFG